MINVTPRYREACKSNIRKSYITAKFGIFDNEAKKIISVAQSSNMQPFVDLSDTYDEIRENAKNYISNEPNRLKLDGSFVFIQNKSSHNNLQNTGYWSSVISNGDNTFTANPKITYTLSKPIEFIDLTLYFQEIVSDFNVYYYLDNALKVLRVVTNNKKLIVETKGDPQPFYFNKIEIEFVKTGVPRRFIKLNEIDFGYYRIISKDEISSLDIIEEISVDSSEIISKSMTLGIKDNKGEYDILNPYNNLKYLKEKQELNIYHNLEVGSLNQEILLGTYMIKSFNNEPKKLLIECYDNLYFMNRVYYNGKYYVNEPISNVVEDLFNYYGYPQNKYEIDKEDSVLLGKTISGFIPIVEFKEALRLICESVCAVVKTTRDGKIFIFRNIGNSVKLFTQSEIKNSQSQNNIFNSAVEINEYTYVQQNDEPIEIYKSTLKKGINNIVFDKAPINYPLYKNNINGIKYGDTDKYNIIDLGASACTIEVLTDTANVLLKAVVLEYIVNSKKYYKNENEEVDEFSVAIVDNTLISSSNSQEVANWKLNRGLMTYSFECNSTPYLEVGDKCKYELPYRDISGNIIKRDFMITKLEFGLGITQEVGGE